MWIYRSIYLYIYIQQVLFHKLIISDFSSFVNNQANIIAMAEKTINYQTEYKSIKGQYDALLQKNQNDVIKIKQKEKLLNEEIQRLKKERESNDAANTKIINQLKEEIEKQRNKHSKGDLTVSLVSPQQQKIKELEIDIRSLMDQNITLTSQNTVLNEEVKSIQYAHQNLVQQNQRLKQYIRSMEGQAKGKSLLHQESQTDVHIFTEEEMKTIKEQLSRSNKQLDKMSAINIDLQHKIKGLEQDSKVLIDRQRKSMAILKKRQSELLLVQSQNQKLKNQTKLKKRKTQANDSICIKCKQFQQQIHLLKQMVKSTKGMVRVKQIEVQKYRLHEQIKDNKSITKGNQKTGSLPPLKKKQNQ